MGMLVGKAGRREILDLVVAGGGAILSALMGWEEECSLVGGAGWL